jgi:hypothetical protein
MIPGAATLPFSDIRLQWVQLQTPVVIHQVANDPKSLHSFTDRSHGLNIVQGVTVASPFKG